MLTHKCVKPFPVWFLLEFTVVSESIQIRLVSRLFLAFRKQVQVLFECSLIFVRAMPVKRFVYFDDASMVAEVGTDGNTPVIEKLVYPDFFSLKEYSNSPLYFHFLSVIP